MRDVSVLIILIIVIIIIIIIIIIYILSFVLHIQRENFSSLNQLISLISRAVVVVAVSEASTG